MDDTAAADDGGGAVAAEDVAAADDDGGGEEGVGDDGLLSFDVVAPWFVFASALGELNDLRGRPTAEDMALATDFMAYDNNKDNVDVDVCVVVY